VKIRASGCYTGASPSLAMRLLKALGPAIGGIGISALLIVCAHAQTQQSDLGLGTIFVEQVNLSGGAIGSWTLIKPSSDQIERVGESTELYNLTPGKYSIFAYAPEGASASIVIYEGDVMLQTVDKPQALFFVNPDQKLRIVIQYRFTRTGIVAIHSDPAGIKFELKGPNDYVHEGFTPETLQDAPKGLYSIQFTPPRGCPTPKPQSAMLEAEKRITLSVTLDCEAAEEIREEQKPDSHPEFLTVPVRGDWITFYDVFKSDWFATHVYEMARLEVLSGYKDDKGDPTGEYRPGDNVTAAELAKITHRIAGIDERESTTPPENPNALDQWFSPFIASAEARGWTIYNDALIDPLRPVTRAEVVVTLLQVLEVPVRWAKGDVFHDVSPRTRYASAIETGAADGMISGYQNESGRPTGMFGPTDPVTRAQIAKIIDIALNLYAKQSDPRAEANKE